MRLRPVSIAMIALTRPAITYAEGGGEADAAADETVAEDYTKQGTLEIGGALGASVSKNTSTFAASPLLGYFVADRIELSGILTFTYTREEEADTGREESETTGALIFEPSYHHPIADNLLAAGAVGVGVGHDGDHFDVRIIPSIGIDIMTSRSNLISPTIRVPILIGKSHGEGGDVGTDLGLAFDVAISTAW